MTLEQIADRVAALEQWRREMTQGADPEQRCAICGVDRESHGEKRGYGHLAHDFKLPPAEPEKFMTCIHGFEMDADGEHFDGCRACTALGVFDPDKVAPPPAESGEGPSLVEAIRAVYDAPEHATYPLDVATRLALKAEEEVATLRAQIVSLREEVDERHAERAEVEREVATLRAQLAEVTRERDEYAQHAAMHPRGHATYAETELAMALEERTAERDAALAREKGLREALTQLKEMVEESPSAESVDRRAVRWWVNAALAPEVKS